MTKYKISSKSLNARTLAIYELDQLIAYISSLDPELKPDEATALAGYVVGLLPELLPELLAENLQLLNQIKEVATAIKRRKSRNPQAN
ncbi:hypothetical protein [Nostoc sp.]|uniref:hypothetical protein n=1 Tax=Nostoc sp. TaxID=1180 RepID=UPI002FF589FF